MVIVFAEFLPPLESVPQIQPSLQYPKTSVRLSSGTSEDRMRVRMELHR